MRLFALNPVCTSKPYCGTLCHGAFFFSKRCSNLRDLKMNVAQLSDAEMSSIGEKEHLTSLALGGCPRLTDETVVCFSVFVWHNNDDTDIFSRLASNSLHCKLAGKIQVICNIKDLRILNLATVGITDFGLGASCISYLRAKYTLSF